MGVRKDCRHYSNRSTPRGDLVQRCRVEANGTLPFSCPRHCLFFEARAFSNGGWERVGEPSDERWGEGISGT